MIELTRKYYLALLFITASLFLLITLNQADFKRSVALSGINNLEDGVIQMADRGLGVLKEAYDAAFSVISGAGLETLALAEFIMDQNREIPRSTAQKQAAAFIRYSRIYGIPLKIAVAVANTESHFRPDAKSSHGSAGVMQVTWRIHKEALLTHGFKGKEELHDPVLGIKAGCLVLSRYIANTGSLKAGLGRYYGGSPEVYWRRVSKNVKKYERYEKER
nr:transglycosylase SLT domain-containing protein [uncultured Dethiosulfovibrio sp.]